ncbi:MAG: EboA domain-containing protein [Verrucomicrobiae bacterium]|nr:EboA domain-containing protein [Verrucomicrobiae bacterium]
MTGPLLDILDSSASPEAVAWLRDTLARLRKDFQRRAFYYAFSGVSRRFDKRARVAPSAGQRAAVEKLAPGVSVDGWDEFRLARVALLVELAGQPAATYRDTLVSVLNTADLREQVAIFSAFPLLPEPEFLVPMARDGLRSNIVDIFDSIALGNPFPAARFDEEAWNQMVLKALFISRPLHRVAGFDARANPALAEALAYLAHERWSAGRYVSPELWRGCASQLTDAIAADLARVAADPDPAQRQAAALVVAANPGHEKLAPLAETLAPEIARVRSGDLTWDSLGASLATAA